MNWSHIDLFSGIGGFALGFGTQPLAFCEIDAGCRAVLEQRWPGTPIYGDVTGYGELPVSRLVSGRQESRPRRLEEFFDVRPDWVVVENVHHSWRRWVPELRREFHRIGYASVPLRVRADEVGAVHARARVFVVANTDCERLRELSRWWSREGRKVADELARAWDSAPRRLGADDGVPNWTHRRHALGNAVVINAVRLVAAAIESNS
jgi:DNA (cytosine-5)-methyltransferase 1